MTENEKAKFQNPFTYNDQRNFVKTSSAYILPELEEREEIAEDVPAPAEDVPAPTPTPAPADTLETVKGQPYTPGSRKSMKKNSGRPASAYSDLYM